MNSSRISIGILGGGQLALMLAEAARALDIDIRVLVRKSSDALPGLAKLAVEGDPNDPAAARAFARTVDIVTLENEFIDPAALEAIEWSGTPLFPTLDSIKLIQDKWHQKQALLHAGLPVTPCRAVTTPDDVESFAREHGWPVVLKRRHLGYDGKGNATVRGGDELPAAWSALYQAQGLYVEAYCPFERELATMVCRSTRGEAAVYPVVETVQENHICHIVRAPGEVSDALAGHARDLAVAAINSIGGIGTMGVELFLGRDHRILINELAPRVHNSGHYTIEACACSQFENHLRAVAGLPLGSVAMIKPAAVMVNLLGHGDGPGEPAGLDKARAIGGAHIHIYGKARSVRGRKMGHITALGNSIEEAGGIATAAAAALRFG